MLAAALALAACAHPSMPPESSTSPPCDAPWGDRSQMKTLAGHCDIGGFVVKIAEPERCGASAYVELCGTGRRRFAPRPESVKGLCVGRPAPNDPCSVVRVSDFGHEVAERMREAGIEVHGHGMGACGKLGDYLAWNYGVSVIDWADADPTLAIVQDRLRAWSIGDVFGVSVQPMACGTLLEGGR
ncbi:MAG TPA: hypothetical protein DFS52_13445 [Myxococcales bacterium]|nr:hypothetical protein [Myxococcales bacterium]